jgi:pimeloyl-ACP methyl ester carboxylesterase
LLIRGSKSDVITLEHVKDFQRLVPHARFVDVGGAGHMVAGDRNDAFTDAITAFIGELEKPVGVSEPSR